MSSSTLIPRGSALTQAMELTGPDGVQWVAYIEGVPPARRWRFLSETLLPGRRMRFDSADDSRVSSTVPAGSPFLTERRLQALLAGATSLEPSQPPIPSWDLLPRRHWELLPAARRAWAWVCDTAAGVSRTVMQRVREGRFTGLSAARGVTATATPTSLPSHLRPRPRFSSRHSGPMRFSLLRANRSLRGSGDRWHSGSGRIAATGVSGLRSPVER